MNLGFSMFFLQFGLGGAGVQIVETRIFLRGTVMKASSHEKHAKQQWKKKTKKKTNSSDPWARSGLSTHKYQKKTQKKQKTKKPRNQKNKKPKKQKNKKKTRLHTPRGGGQMQSVGSCLFVFFCFFCFFVFWFFGFLFFCFFGFFGLCVDSHCRCAKQRLPGTVSGCTRSKVDTLQYSNVCYDIVHSANE